MGTRCGFIPCLLAGYITNICLLIGGITREVVPALNLYFDAVLVHGDSQLSRLEDHFPWVSDIGIPVVYTGFVSERLEDASRPDDALNRYVLVSAGGGAEGLAPCRTVY